MSALYLTNNAHTHMTNTRMTDHEVLELRYPVRLGAFAIRRGSGGAGRWRGGDGAADTARRSHHERRSAVQARQASPPSESMRLRVSMSRL